MPRLTLAMLGIATLIVSPASSVIADETAWVSDARNIATTMPPKMMEVLKEETKKGGAANATVVCREKAPAMAKVVRNKAAGTSAASAFACAIPRPFRMTGNALFSKTSTVV